MSFYQFLGLSHYILKSISYHFSRIYVHSIRFIIRLAKLREIPELLPMINVRKNPCRLIPVRKTLDSWTFTLYSHWVKKGHHMNQNRAALFQHDPRVVERRASTIDVINPNLLSDISVNDQKQLYTV